MRRQQSVIVLIIIPAVVAFLVTMLVINNWSKQETLPQIAPTHSPTSQAGIGALPSTPDVDDSVPAGDNDSLSATSNSATAEDSGTIEGCTENSMHLVSEGDVTSNIAERYGVTVADLTTINQMIDPAFDPDNISVGQMLTIPDCILPTPTVAPTPTATVPPTDPPPPTPNATATEEPVGTVILVINAVLNPEDITTEVVEILSEGSLVNLEDWILTDGLGNEFVFPSMTLYQGGQVAVHTGAGDNTPLDLYWGLDEAIWQSGGIVYLYDPERELHDQFEIP